MEGLFLIREIQRRILEDVIGDYEKYGYGRMAIELKGEAKFIGFAGLKYLPDMAYTDLGYRLMSKYWGRGIATEAGQVLLDYGFNTIGLSKIFAMVLPDNHASVRVLEKLGFEWDSSFMEDGAEVHLYQVNRGGSK